MTTTRLTRAELVRRRRMQEATKQRFDATRPTAGLRPLVGTPRRSQTLPVARTAAGRGRQQFNVAMPSLPTVRLPTMPAIHVGWRLASFSLVLLLGAMLVRLLTEPRMFVDGITLGGNVRVPGEEIYAASGAARQHIFWADPAVVQQRIEQVSGIAAAVITVEWPSNITIIVQERVPVLLWTEADKSWWVDADGLKFKVRGDLPGLLPIEVDDAMPGTAAGSPSAPPEAVQGALQLKQLRPNIERLHYGALHGLSYLDGRGWRGYFGVGTDMAEKLAVYETLIDNLLSRGIRPTVVSVENVHAPYYRK